MYMRISGYQVSTWVHVNALKWVRVSFRQPVWEGEGNSKYTMLSISVPHLVSLLQDQILVTVLTGNVMWVFHTGHFRLQEIHHCSYLHFCEEKKLWGHSCSKHLVEIKSKLWYYKNICKFSKLFCSAVWTLDTNYTQLNYKWATSFQ